MTGGESAKLYDQSVRIMRIIFRSIASAGLVLYAAAITIRPAELRPGPLLFWPYEWLWWLILPTLLAGLGALLFEIAQHSAKRTSPPGDTAPTAAPTSSAPVRGTARIAKPWTEHAGIASHRNIHTGNRNLRWLSNGAKAGTLEQAPRGRWEVFDEDDNHLGTVSTERDGMELVAGSASSHNASNEQ